MTSLCTLVTTKQLPLARDCTRAHMRSFAALPTRPVARMTTARQGSAARVRTLGTIRQQLCGFVAPDLEFVATLSQLVVDDGDLLCALYGI